MKDLKNLVSRWFGKTALVIAMIIAGIGITATPASAATVYVYGVNMTQACQEQGSFAASYWNTGPYGWYCYNLTTSPPFFVSTGGVDVQRWCSRHYSQFPKIRAVIYQNNLWGWRCWYDTSWG